MKKVIAAASLGGHWVQLLRISRSMEDRYDMVYLSTHPKCATMVEGQKYYQMKNFSRWDAWKVVPSFIRVLGILLLERPDAIITTGAAPGLVCVMAGKLLGVKTIWVDSIANVEHLSASGRLAKRFASRVYTQWEDLKSNSIVYQGNILGYS
jgi:UDP-N-acetylglucosamine:LPS N-acetylglucosamine transferase